MELRVTLQTAVNRALSHTRRATDQLGILLEQAAAGKKILQASDNPLGAVAVLENQAQDKRLGTYLTNITEVRTTLDIGVSGLLGASDILSRARGIAVAGAHAINDANAFESLAQEVDNLITRMGAAANTQQGGRFIYSGTATQTAPFALPATTNPNTSPVINYAGANERHDLTVSQNQTVSMFYTGREIFQSRQRAATVYSNAPGAATGAAAGTGTDSATGRGTLTVAHTATVYGGGSGVAPGTGSAAGDTIIGAHTLTVIDTSGLGTFGTVSLDGGPAVGFTNIDTNLQVSGPNGAVVFVDTTTITPGYVGPPVAATGTGTLSVDGGASSVAITFAGNQIVTNSTTGAVTNVNSTNILRTGNTHLEYTGTYDAFQVLFALRDDLRNARGLSSADQATALSGLLTEMDRVRTGILNVVGEQSANLQNLEGLERRVSDVQLETKRLVAEFDGFDLSEAVIGLQQQQNQLRLTLATTARVFDQSLLDFIGNR